VKPGRHTAVPLRFALLAAIAAACVFPCIAQVSGAIYTTRADGTTVNANIYDLNTDVYLNGGPQNATSAGLPVGIYYFQVTDPSGSTLLSTDNAACRQLQVTSNSSGKGVVYGVPATVPASCDTGLHSLGTYNAANNSIPVQLAPFDATPNAGGEYKVWLFSTNADAGCTTAPDSSNPRVLNPQPASCAKTDNFKVRTTPSTPSITGSKYYDRNTNGSRDSGEVSIASWKIDVTFTGSSSANTVSTFTNTAGQWGVVVPSGTNSILACEEMPVGSTYIQTGPIPNTVSGVANATATRCWTVSDLSSDINGLDFGNVCLAGGGGLTLGFWSNRNGQALVSSADLTFLSSLNLRNADGRAFDPGNYSALKTWLLNATATNMSYMLSAQLAAMELNVAHGFVNSSAMIYAPLSASNQNGFASIGNLMAEANAALSTNTVVLSGNPARPYLEALKNYLDAANNNTNFVQSGPCAFAY
jgi:hypothetical protein